jgi:asparagine synthase (glutamine-hydrolysing)
MALGASSNDIVHSHRAPGLFMLRASSRLQNTDAAVVSFISGNTCAWDGRLDNREEILTLIGHPPSDRTSDSQLALALYEAEGVNGLRNLIGDWSLVIWDATTRNLLLASDYAGIRPLYYHRAGNRLIWSSTLQSLVQWAAVEALDEEYVADFLSRGQAVGRTPYRDIYPVPPGRVVRAAGRKLTIDPFWRLPLSESRLAHADEYEAQLLTLFRDAVRVRLGARTPVCAELSVGLDSSSIVCMAGRLISNGSVAPSELITFSYRYEGSTDEKFYQAVTKRCGLQSIRRILPIIRL